MIAFAFAVAGAAATAYGVYRVARYAAQLLAASGL